MSLGYERGINPSSDKLSAERPEESRCCHCGARVTATKSLGEVGHRRDCEVRDERYHGDKKSWGEQEVKADG